MLKYLLVIFLFLVNICSASITVNLTWTANDPAQDVTQYDVYYGTATGTYVWVGSVATNSYDVVVSDETQSMFFAIKATNSLGQTSGYSEELVCKIVTTTLPAIGASLSWLPVQAVESGQAHTITVTPASGYAMTAYRIDGGAWQENPASNEISLGTVSADKTLEIITQRQASVWP